MGKTKLGSAKALDEIWWNKIEYILSFIEPIYEMLRIANTNKATLHLVYDKWDSMTEKVKSAIYHHQGKRDHERLSFYKMVDTNLLNQKYTTPFLAHSLNLK